MMGHSISSADQGFRRDFEAFLISPADFNHRAHLRLAYIYLAENDTEKALELIRGSLLSFLQHNDIEFTKYHETMTRAWIMAVRHFMEITPGCASSDSFIERNPMMLDSKIMMSHYSAEVLFSDEARARFVEPDLNPIPRHEG